MDPKPDVFISAVSGDLASAREVVKNALLDIGCHPVVQTHFAPDHQSIRKMIEDKIAPCQAVIHLVGLRYGFEPKVPEVPRRSYTQIEHDVAKATGKEVYLFLCSEGYPYDTGGEPEEPVKAGLQAAHRQAIRAGDKLYTVVSTPAELKDAIHKLKIVHRAVATAASDERKEVRAGLDHLASQNQEITKLVTEKNYDPETLREKLIAQIKAQYAGQLAAAGGKGASYAAIRRIEDDEKVALAQIEDVIATITVGLVAGADPVFERATAILENEGIDTALQYLAAHRAQLLEEADVIVAQRDAAEEKLHTKLEPLLLQAGLHQTNLEWAPAREIYEDIATKAPHWSRARLELGELLRELAKVNEAEPHLRAALDLAGSDGDRASALNELAHLYHNMARHAEGEPLYREALEIYERLHGKDSTEVAEVLNNLAALLQATNRLEEAEPLMARVVSIFEKSYGANHTDVATALNNLAGVLNATNRLEEAEPMYRRALAIDEASFGKDHPKVATRLNNLAGLLKATNRPEEAEPMYRRALAIGEASFGKDHPNVAIVLNNLALLLRDTNRL
ncbi:MAG: tetratricopeptide repeat protein, partial [Verrucomicrobiales bacterium]